MCNCLKMSDQAVDLEIHDKYFVVKGMTENITVVLYVVISSENAVILMCAKLHKQITKCL